jgi:transcriptional regulator with XRE-family HTH domain
MMTDVLRKAVLKTGLNWSELSRLTGLKRCSVERFANGKTSLWLNKADLLAEALGLKLRPKGKSGRKGRKS